jgi:protein-tyrosine-phosphatase
MGHSAASLSSKGLHEVPIEEMDVIVSLIGDDGVRFLPGGTSARVESWWIPDPYGEDERVFAAAAREIERRIRTLFDDLLAPELLLD